MSYVSRDRWLRANLYDRPVCITEACALERSWYATSSEISKYEPHAGYFVVAQSPDERLVLELGSLALSLLLSSEVLMSVEPFHQSSSGVEQRPAIHHDCGRSWTGPKRCSGKFNIMEPLTDHCHRILGHVQCKSRIPKKTTAKAVVQKIRPCQWGCAFEYTGLSNCAK